MVTINLIVEGGVYTDNVSAATASNVESLRQSLHSFFSRVLEREDISISLFMGAGYRNAAKKFINTAEPSFLFTDSDCSPAEINQWFDRLKNTSNPDLSIIIPEEKKHRVFFMIQEMEAWFLKQPECLERWAVSEGYTRMEPDIPLSSHSTLRGKEIEEIAKPSDKLAILMKKYFKKNKKGASYGKLRTAPGLLDALEPVTLLPKDAELTRFKSFLGTIQ